MARRGYLVVVALLVVLAGCVGGVPVDDPTGGESTTTPATTVDATNGTLTVHFINVGQSVSVLAVGPTGETMLVDSGDWRDDGEHVLDYLRRQDVTRIDYLVTSHADADHVGGHAAVIEYFETQADGVGAVYDPGIPSSSQTYEAYLDAVEEHNVTLFLTREGDLVPFEGVDVSVLAPPETDLGDGDRNENSLVFRLAYGDARFLIPGDAEATEEEYVVHQYGADLRATVLSAGHHGSSSSSSAPFLEAVGPRVAVVSSAYDSQYGHPHEETLDRLAQWNVTTYWTAVHGDVVFETGGETVTVRAQRAATTDPLALRDASPIDPGATDPLTQVDSFAVGSTPSLTMTTTQPGSTTATTPSPALVVATVHADADGNDGENLNDEYVVLRNDGDETLDIGGWEVRDVAGHTYRFPAGSTLAPGASVTLHTGAGTDTATDRYWGADGPVWNNDGDTVVVTDDRGTTVLEVRY
ncbi:lamin tail domain-containing protein [Halobacteriaceae archaeon GCM10025711]